MTFPNEAEMESLARVTLFEKIPISLNPFEN